MPCGTGDPEACLRACVRACLWASWRVHCSLLITAADNSSWIGTGWFIGPRTLITAGHVVYITNSGVPGRHKFEQQINDIAKRASRLAESTGARVSLVGHSLGGMFAREIGRRHPQLIDRVLTMGSPAHVMRSDEPPSTAGVRVYTGVTATPSRNVFV